MSMLEKIYEKSPIFFQNIMVSVAGYQKNRTRYGKVYRQHRKFLKTFDRWKLEDKIDYQQKELKKFVDYSMSNSLFYRDLYKDIDYGEIKQISDLKKLPIVDKEMLRENIDQAITVYSKNSVQASTGGTTGKSLIVQHSIEDTMKRMATLDHFKSRLGFEHRKMRRATFNGKHIVPAQQKKKKFGRYNKACNQMIYSTFHISDENLGYYVESLNKFKPHAIDGLTMSIRDLASYIERYDVKLEFRPIAIFPTAETLTQSARELIERTFNCKVYNQYASGEGAPLVTECNHNRLHIEVSSGVFEQFEDDNEEVLVTSFFTYGTPLIRYRIGDSMKFNTEKIKCECGLDTPIVEDIQGRKMDFLYSSSGSKVSLVNIANGFRYVPNAVIRGQLLQDKIGEVTIKVEVDQDNYKKEYDDLIIQQFQYKFGIDTDFTVVHVNEIPKEDNGKFRIVKNNVS